MGKSVTAQWAKDNVKNIKLIDVRTPGEFSVFNIEGSKNVPVMGMLQNTEQFINKEDEFYIICASGGRSGAVINELEKEGYNNLVQVEGGVQALL